MPKRDEPLAHCDYDAESMINASAWFDGLHWAILEPEIRKAFKDDTGVDLGSPTSPIDRLVDDATGKREGDLRDFVDWFTENIWGAEMDPREPDDAEA